MELSAQHIHERTDAKVRPVAIFLVVMFLTLAFSFAFTTVLFEFFEQRAETVNRPRSPMQIVDERPSGAALLQVTPGLDLRELRKTEDERLNGYGWVDEGAGVAHIPVDAAIDLVLEQGLPARGPAAEQSAPTAAPVEGEQE